MNEQDIIQAIDAHIQGKKYDEAIESIYDFYAKNPTRTFLDARLYDCFLRKSGFTELQGLPRLQQQEDNLNDLLLHALSGVFRADIARFTYGPQQVAKSLINKKYRILYQSELQEQSSLLLSCGISPSFIDEISNGSGSFNDLHGFTREDIHTVAELDTFDAIENKGKLYLCPFVGAKKRTQVNLWINSFCCDGPTPESNFILFALKKKSWSDADPVPVYIFPGLKLCICADDTVDPDFLLIKLSELYAVMTRNLSLVAGHVECMKAKDAPVPVGIVDFACGHIGHTLWNIIPGKYHTLMEKHLNIDYVFEWKVNCIFGDCKVLFTEFFTSTMQHILFDSEKSFYQALGRTGALLLNPVSLHIDQDIAERISALSASQASEEFKRNLLRKTEPKTPAILVSLRCGNREWTNQYDELPLLLNKILEMHPSAVFLIDGITCDNSKVSTHKDIDSCKERSIVHNIIASLPQDSVFDCTNITMAESILACNACDFYISPIGSGMVKFRWIANKPGIAFSNTLVLNSLGESHPLGVWDCEKIRTDIRLAHYVASEHIVSDDTGSSTRANFQMSHSSILDLLQEAGFLSQKWPRKTGPFSKVDIDSPQGGGDVQEEKTVHG